MVNQIEKLFRECDIFYFFFILLFILIMFCYFIYK